MIKVYIWYYVGKGQAWGHASMEVNQRYISWWPQGDRRLPYKGTALPSKVISSLGNLYSVLPIGNRTFYDDLSDEKGQPNSIITIEGLNKNYIIFWWNHFALSYGGTNEQGPIQNTWSTLDLNCSSVVALGLKEGGGDNYSSYWKYHNYIWRPNDVKNFAESIVQGLKNKSL